MIKAIVFDLDDTLISERDYIKSGFKYVSKIISDRYKLDNNEVYEVMRELFKESSKNVFNRVLDNFNIKYKKEEVLYLVKEYREHKPNIEFYKDVIPTINKLRNNGYKLGIITDGYKETQNKKIDVLNCKTLFDEIIITDELGKEYWKPHERSYKLMSKKLNVDLSEMVYIGDNEAKDFVIANKLGIKTFKIIRNNAIYTRSEVEKEFLAEKNIKNLLQLFAYIRSKNE